MTYIIISAVLFAASITLFLISVHDKHERENYLAEELSKARRDLAILRHIADEQKSLLAGDGLVEFTSTYAPSEADLTHYKNQKTLVKSIRGRLAHNIANDMIREFGDPQPNSKGVYSYKIVAKCVWKNNY